MAGKKRLPPVRLADGGDAPAAPMSLADASEHGTRLDELKAMRRILIAHMAAENTLARDLAALTRQVREVSKEIESLSAQEAEENPDAGGWNDESDARWEPKAI